MRGLAGHYQFKTLVTVGALALGAAGMAGCAVTAAASSQLYDGHRWRVTTIERLAPKPHTIQVPSYDNAWIDFDGQGRLVANDVLQHFKLRYRATKDGFVTTHRDAADFGWYADDQDARVDEALTAVIGGRVVVESVSTSTIRLTQQNPAGGRASSYVITAELND